VRAIVRERYGSPEVIELREVDDPAVGDDEVLVRVRAVSVNPAEWFAVTGTPTIARPSYGLRRPKNARIGVDFAGVVEDVGRSVTRFRVGDEVFGGKAGAFAELVAIAQDGAIASKPANVTFEQAAAVPTAAVTALQGLRDKGGIRPGRSVLINGASGGVGTFAIQIAKALG
jgi:NADPH:quinone reductase-like Zn-dependent oxidoreductase